jgi:hypothetical protein
LAKTALKTAGITRAAFEYQDLIGIEVLIDFFRNPARYAWVELESEDRAAGYLDDVVALCKDGKFEYTQVKFTVDPNRYPLSWDWLLESKAHGTSRLKKWADSLSTYGRSGGVGRAELRTNRTPDREFAKGLHGNKVRLNKIPAARRAEVERELGGTSKAHTLFKQFRFRHSEVPDAQGLEQRLKGTIVPTDTTTDGWMLLRQQVRRWATEKRQPEPDGKIRHAHLVQIISKKTIKADTPKLSCAGHICGAQPRLSRPLSQARHARQVVYFYFVGNTGTRKKHVPKFPNQRTEQEETALYAASLFSFAR